MIVKNIFIGIGLIAILVGIASYLHNPTENPVYSDKDWSQVVAYSESHRGEAIIVYDTNQQKILLEEYYNGYQSSEQHILFSGTKSFTGVMLAMLIQQEYLDSYDDVVSDTITEWQGTSKEFITYRQLMSLTSGLEPGERGLIDTVVEQSISAEVLSDPGEEFRYGPNAFVLLGEVVFRKTGQQPDDYLQQEILDPLDIRIDRWERNSDGRPALDRGAYMTAQHWLEFGIFVYQTIEEGENTLIEPEILRQVKESQPGTNDQYGISVWTTPDGDVEPNRTRLRERLRDTKSSSPYSNEFYTAAGGANQRLIFLPDEELIIVHFGKLDMSYSDSVLIQYILEGAE